MPERTTLTNRSFLASLFTHRCRRSAAGWNLHRRNRRYDARQSVLHCLSARFDLDHVAGRRGSRTSKASDFHRSVGTRGSCEAGRSDLDPDRSLLFARRRAELDGDGDRPSVVPLTEIGKATRKLVQRRAIRKNERKRAIFEHGGHAARSQTMFAALVHNALD
jgi:hypothetical protein